MLKIGLFTSEIRVGNGAHLVRRDAVRLAGIEVRRLSDVARVL